MRENLFRGYEENGKHWVNGSLIQKNPDKNGYVVSFIVPDKSFSRTFLGNRLNLEMFRVNSNSVQQFTGLCDRNGRRIFEGDYISILDKSDDSIVIQKVLFKDGVFGIENWSKKRLTTLNFFIPQNDDSEYEIEVTGDDLHELNKFAKEDKANTENLNAIVIDGVVYELHKPNIEGCNHCDLDKFCDKFKEALCDVFTGGDKGLIFKESPNIQLHSKSIDIPNINQVWNVWLSKKDNPIQDKAILVRDKQSGIHLAHYIGKSHYAAITYSIEDYKMQSYIQIIAFNKMDEWIYLDSFKKETNE